MGFAIFVALVFFGDSLGAEISFQEHHLALAQPFWFLFCFFLYLKLSSQLFTHLNCNLNYLFRFKRIFNEQK